jgi:tetratricopeptide (TPR) repeat protein
MKSPLVRFLTIITLVFLPISNYAQEDVNPRGTFVEAESYFLFEEYKDALPLYQKILRIEPDNYNVTYKIGMCYLNDPYLKEKSIKYLLEASRHITKEYKTNSYKEKMAPPEVNYYLGQAYRITGQFDKALEYYSNFKKDLDPAVFDIDVVNEEIASCQIAREMIPAPVYLDKTNAGTQVNSRFADYNPLISGDGKTIVFTRDLQFYTGVFISHKNDNGTWSEPYNLTPDFELDGNSVATGVSYNGDEIFVYRSDNFDGNIYSSKSVNGRFQVLKKLNANINTKYWESSASPSPDGKYLYFSSNREGGFGGLDIYKAPRISGGEWGTPINLGPVVNSRYNDDSPFISTDGQKLFFASLGHNGMGGFDIFVSEMVGPSTWARPVNLGYPVNTPDDDMFFCPVANPNYTGIYAAYDENSTYGMLDIYWVKIYNSVFPREFTIRGKVSVPSDKLLNNNNLKVSVIDSKQNKIVEQVSVNANGEFLVNANQGDYQLLVDGSGIKPVSVSVSLSLTQKNSDVELPLIETQIAAVGEDNLVVVPTELPKLEIKGDKYIITDKSPIEIKLSVQAGSKLDIQNFVEGKPDSKDAFVLTKDKFTYNFSPKPGDNRLVFTVTDGKGNINQQEVTVYYKAPAEVQPIASDTLKPAQAKLAEIASLANGGLKKYLLSLDSLNYNSILDLYNKLIAEAAANGYSQQEVDDLITLLLTQRNKDEFIADSKSEESLSMMYTNDTIIANSIMPLIIVQKTKSLYGKDKDLIDESLIGVVPFDGSAGEVYNYILSFTDINSDSISTDNIGEIYKSLQAIANPEQLSKSIELSSTTENLDKFYFNLIAASDEEMRKLLLGLNFDSLNIINSIDLVQHLFGLADQGKLKKTDIISAIENSKKSEKQNLQLFKESLAKAASGQLKAYIQELDVNNLSGNGYANILETLLRDSKSKGYNKSEVYDLLLKMIGIDNVDDFIAAMRKYTTGDLDSLLATLDKSKFSKPIEIIQYLLSEAGYFDFTDSDINNLLLKMLLEKGISGYSSKEELYAQELIRKRRFITTIVLANILLIVIILLFWRRKKKKDNEEHD